MPRIKTGRTLFLISIFIKSLVFNIKRTIRKLIVIFGIFIVFLILFSFTSGPFWIFFWLGTKGTQIMGSPQTIILLGGGGMPSESGLIRCYHAANLANRYPNANVIIALPADSLTKESSIYKMRNELIMRGVDSTKILLEANGRNTRGQAIHCLSLAESTFMDTVIIVTSPEHMLRSLKTFRKVGFQNVGGYSAFEYAIESNLEFEDKKLGGRKGYAPQIGKNINLRYRFWSHLKYEILIIRELFALSYYKLRGWI